MGRHRDEGEPRGFSGITLWQTADVHPCSCPYLLPSDSPPRLSFLTDRHGLSLSFSLPSIPLRRYFMDSSPPRDLEPRIFTIRQASADN